MKTNTCIVLICLLWAGASADGSAYSGYKVYQVTPKTKEHADVLLGLQQHEQYVDFWSKFRTLDKPVDIMVAPVFQMSFNTTLQKNGIEFSELIPNVAKVLEAERINQLSAARDDSSSFISFEKYQSYAEIQDYLVSLSYEYRDIVTLYSIGHTSEGRDMYMIKISTGGDKPAILIDGGIHAREWIAPATALYIINQLVENPDNKNLIETVDWYIIPVLNPDGYEYTQIDSSTRFWRKTRSVGTKCIGADANRNFDFHWMEGGASALECSDTYAGPAAMSEPEARALDSVLTYFDNFKLYLSFHSYGPYMLYPWGYIDEVPDNWEELQALAEDANAAISAVAGTEYVIGSSTSTMYVAAGASDDYAMGKGGIELVYTIELPGGGRNGFDPPPSSILPIVTETWEGVKVFHDYIASQDW